MKQEDYDRIFNAIEKFYAAIPQLESVKVLNVSTETLYETSGDIEDREEFEIASAAWDTIQTIRTRFANNKILDRYYHLKMRNDIPSEATCDSHRAQFMHDMQELENSTAALERFVQKKYYKESRGL